MDYNSEFWRNIKYDQRYQVSSFGNFRKVTKNGHRYLKPFKKNNLYVIKIKNKQMNCARLVANAFIKILTNDDRVYHKNKLKYDNYFKNLLIVSKKELGKRTGHISKSKRVVEIQNNEIIREWASARKAAKELFISYQTVMDYCNKKVKQPMFNLMWEEDYFNEALEPFSWEHKGKRR